MVLVTLLILGCKQESSSETEITKIEVPFTIERFDVAFGNAKTEDLPKLQQTFPFLFPDEVADSVWVQKLQDTLQQQMFVEAKTYFEDVKALKEDLEQLFQHLKYHDSTFLVPRVITVADNVDYRNKIVVNKDLLIINLLNYLGSDHEFYQNIPKYLSSNMEASQIIPDVANAYAKMYVSSTPRKTFLEELIYFGKLLHFKDVVIPRFTDAQKIGYTELQLQWAQLNEAQIWSYFVERELLFSSDNTLVSRFLMPAPFSKFYLELDNESPGRIGQFIGWQIVQSYAERTDANILEIMQTDAETIFNTSKYKPKR